MTTPSASMALPPGVPRGLAQNGYPRIIAWSLGFLLVCLAGLWAVTSIAQGRLGAGLIPLRNFLGYGHFFLAYIFAWKMICREIGQRQALAYLAVFGAIVTAYAATQRWLLPASLDAIFIMLIFMVHHASNEVLFREQTRNGHRPLTWTPQRVWWVALAVGFLLVDRSAVPRYTLHAAFPFFLSVWLVGWLGYGVRYLMGRHASLLARLGWLGAGAVVASVTLLPHQVPLLAVQHRFAFLVIYHYMIWYVFFTDKLLFRRGDWGTQAAESLSLRTTWAFAMKIPLGFVGLVLLGNALLLAFFMAAGPLTRWATSTTELNFFHLHTFAHIVFGVGISNWATPPARSPAVTTTPAPPESFA